MSNKPLLKGSVDNQWEKRGWGLGRKGLFLEEPLWVPSTTQAANADTCRSFPLQVNVDLNALKGKARKKKKRENMHSVCWTVPTGMWYNLQGKVLLSTCGGNVPGCFQIVLHPNDTTDFHQLYIPTITKQTIKIITIIKKIKIRASSWSTRRCSDLAGRPLKVSVLRIQRRNQNHHYKPL